MLTGVPRLATRVPPAACAALDMPICACAARLDASEGDLERALAAFEADRDPFSGRPPTPPSAAIPEPPTRAGGVQIDISFQYLLEERLVNLVQL